MLQEGVLQYAEILGFFAFTPTFVRNLWYNMRHSFRVLGAQGARRLRKDRSDLNGIMPA